MEPFGCVKNGQIFRACRRSIERTSRRCLSPEEGNDGQTPQRFVRCMARRIRYFGVTHCDALLCGSVRSRYMDTRQPLLQQQHNPLSICIQRFVSLALIVASAIGFDVSNTLSRAIFLVSQALPDYSDV